MATTTITGNLTGAVNSGATLVVCASDRIANKWKCDYIADGDGGTDDADTILLAEAALASTGGLIQLTEGNYYIGDAASSPGASLLKFTQDNVSLKGAGEGATIIQADSSVTNGAHIYDGIAMCGDNAVLSDLTVDGTAVDANNAKIDYLFYIGGGPCSGTPNNITIERVTGFDCGTDGVTIAQSNYSTLKDFYIYDCYRGDVDGGGGELSGSVEIEDGANYASVSNGIVVNSGPIFPHVHTGQPDIRYFTIDNVTTIAGSDDISGVDIGVADSTDIADGEITNSEFIGGCIVLGTSGGGNVDLLFDTNIIQSAPASCSAAAIVSYSGNIEISNNIIRDSAEGAINATGGGKVVNNTIEDNTSENTVSVNVTNLGIIQGNIITGVPNSYYAVVTTGSGDAKILDNEIDGGGIKVTSSGINKIVNNTVTGSSGRGIWLQGGEQHITNNNVASSTLENIFANTGAIYINGGHLNISGEDGIELQDVSYIDIEGVHVEGAASSYFSLYWDFASTTSIAKINGNMFEGQPIKWQDNYAGTHFINITGNVFNSSGFTMAGTTSTITYINFEGNEIYNATLALQLLSKTRATVIGNTIVGGGSSGGISSSGTHAKICDNYVEAIAWDGMWITGADSVICNNTLKDIDAGGNESDIAYNAANLQIFGNHMTGSAHNAGIRGQGTLADNAHIYGNYITGTVTNDIDFDTGADNNVVENNEFSTLTNGGSGNVFRNNIGFVTEAEGITGAIATGANTAHGLSGTPDYVIVTPADTGVSDVYVDTLGGTNFVINYAGGGTHVFYWRAVYAP